MNIDQKINKIIFCDSLPEIEKGSDILYIALKPKVYAYLKQKGVLVHNTLPYFTNESHEEVLKKSEILMAWVRNNTGFVDLGIGVKAAYEHNLTFWFRLTIHYCLWVVEILINAVDQHQPKVLVVVSSALEEAMHNLYVAPKDGFLSYLAHCVAQAYKIESQNGLEINGGNRNKSSNNLLNKLKALMIFVVRCIKFKLFEAKAHFKSKDGKNKLIIFTSQLYQMDKLIEKLKREHKREHKSVSFYFLKLPIIIPAKLIKYFMAIFKRKYRKSYEIQCKLMESFINTLASKNELFSYKGISFVELVARKLNNDLKDFVLEYTLWYFLLSDHFKRIVPRAVVSNASRRDDLMIAELCKNSGIPNILVSHGSHVRPRNEFEKIEWGEHGRQFFSVPLSYIAMPTPASEGYLEVFPSETAIIKTGPLIWGTPTDERPSKQVFNNLFSGAYSFDKTRVVLHAGTPKSSNSLRLYVYETSDEYIQALCDLAQAVKGIPRAVAVIKFRSVDEISIETVKKLVPFSDKVALCVNDSFINVLGVADLLVSFSSTAIDEALQNRIPVLLYGGGGRYQFIPAFEIEPGKRIEPAAIYHLKEAEYLQTAIAEILSLCIKSKYGYLFDRHIYPMKERRSLEEALPGVKKESVHEKGFLEI